jgi:hypothetical protein
MAKKQILDDELDGLSEEVEVFNYTNSCFGCVQVDDKEFRLVEILFNANDMTSDKAKFVGPKYDTSMRAEFELTKLIQGDIMKRINKKRKEALKRKR